MFASSKVLTFGYMYVVSLPQSVTGYPVFRLCDEQLSNQSHYDFGLHALKSVLVSAGNIKRDKIQKTKKSDTASEGSIAERLPEQEVHVLLYIQHSTNSKVLCKY